MPISNLGDLTPFAWYKADAGVLEAIAGSDAAEDNDNVERWQDQSGNARHADQATSSKRPTYQTNEINGLPVVRFDGVDDVLQTAAFASEAQPYTMVLVVKANPDATIRAPAYVNTGVLRISATNAWQLRTGSTNLNDGTATAAAAVLVGVANGVSSKIRLNGTASTGDAGTGAADRVSLGAAATANFFNSDIAEFAFFDRELNSTEIADAEQHLREKWGLITGTTSLSVGVAALDTATTERSGVVLSEAGDSLTVAATAARSGLTVAGQGLSASDATTADHSGVTEVATGMDLTAAATTERSGDTLVESGVVGPISSGPSAASAIEADLGVAILTAGTKDANAATLATLDVDVTAQGMNSANAHDGATHLACGVSVTTCGCRPRRGRPLPVAAMSRRGQPTPGCT